jgi:uncharacterized protein
MSRTRSRLSCAASLLAHALPIVLFSVFVPLAMAAGSPDLVISQVYGGGGNSGATLKNDFIEIFNRDGNTVNLNGWSVQYASAAGTSWQVTTLSGSLAPGQYYLIQESQGAGGTTSLPSPDASGAIAMSATAGKVALVHSTTALTVANPSVADLIGYGSTATGFETSPAAGLSNTTAALRAGNGCSDTDNNSLDFAIVAPAPRNSASPVNICGAANPASIPAGNTVLLTVPVPPRNPPSAVLSVTADLSSIRGSTSQPFFNDGTNGDAAGGDNTFSFSYSVPFDAVPGSKSLPFTVRYADGAQVGGTIGLTINTPPPVELPIHDIQGSGATSPYVGRLVSTTGIVTAVRFNNGFFIQTPDNQIDADPNTSEGIFVFTSTAPPSAATIGNLVRVVGLVQEFIPSADPNSPPATEIASPTVTLLSTGNSLPEPITITAADTDPNGSIAQLEKYEGMRVHVDVLTVTGPTQGTIDEANATSASSGVFYGVLPGIARPFREPGIEVPDPLPAGAPANVPRFDANPERIRVNTRGQVGGAALEVTAGVTVTNITGPLDYSFRTYTILTDPATPPAATANASATPAPAPAADELTIASFNMERFFDTTDDPGISDVALTATAFANRLNKASLTIRNVMNSPDIVGVEEMENLVTLQAVAKKVNDDTVAAGQPDPKYRAYLIEGNDIGGIDVGFLVKGRVNVLQPGTTNPCTSEDGTSCVVQVGKDTTYTTPTGSQELLNDRPSLILEATLAQSGGDALPFTVIVNHLRSLSGVDDPADGARVRAKRRAQAEFLANLIQVRQTANPNENIVAVGDFNAFGFNDGYVDMMGTIKGTPTPADQVVLASGDLVNPDLIDLADTLPPDQRYSFNFDGNAQELDHVLVNPPMLSRFSRFAIARNNSDFPESFRNDPNRSERISDHDPAVAYFHLPAPDTTAPVLHLHDLTVEATSAAGAAVSYSVSATDNVDGDVPVNCDPASGSTFPLGATTVNCSATDKHNNVATGSFTLTVEDTTPPVISSHADITAEATGTSGAVVTFNLPTATDAVSTPKVSCTPDSGSSFALGHTAVTCTATDQAGNSAQTTFDVLVVDTTVPVISCGTPDGLWHGTDVTIVCHATDGGSGLAIPADATFTLATSVAAGVETANASTSSHTVCDHSGNCSTAGPIAGNKVDKRGPQVSITSPNNATYLLNQAIASNYNCTDGGSGVSTCSGPVASGANINTASVGAQTFTVNSTDVVGNASSTTVSYTVGYNVCLLYDTTHSNKAGSTVPIRLQLCDADGKNVSNAAVSLTAVRLVLVWTGASLIVDDSGNANPDANFRFDNASYIFNLSTKGLQTGTYNLIFLSGNDPTPHAAPFQVR